MLEFIDNFLLSNVIGVASLLGAMTVIAIGLPFVSFKGGIPRVFGIIVNKPKAFILFVIGLVATWWLITPLVTFMLEYILTIYIRYAIALFFSLSTILIFEFDSRMRWNYKKYGYVCIILSVIFFVVRSFI